MRRKTSAPPRNPLNIHGFVLGKQVRFSKARDCCLIDKARTLASAATVAGQPFEQIAYPKTEHDFVKCCTPCNSTSYSDALQRRAAELKEFLGS
jgi:acetyl esterase/lipase